MSALQVNTLFDSRFHVRGWPRPLTSDKTLEIQDPQSCLR